MLPPEDASERLAAAVVFDAELELVSELELLLLRTRCWAYGERRVARALAPSASAKTAS